MVVKKKSIKVHICAPFSKSIKSVPTLFEQVMDAMLTGLTGTAAFIDDIFGARGVMVIIVGNGHGNTSSNPGRDIAFHIALIPLGKV